MIMAMNIHSTSQIRKSEAPDYPKPLPYLRRKIIIESYELIKPVKHEIFLFTTDRIDCYQMVVDGVVIEERVGWSKVLDKVRKAFIRVGGMG